MIPEPRPSSETPSPKRPARSLDNRGPPRHLPRGGVSQTCGPSDPGRLGQCLPPASGSLPSLGDGDEPVPATQVWRVDWSRPKVIRRKAPSAKLSMALDVSHPCGID